MNTLEFLYSLSEEALEQSWEMNREIGLETPNNVGEFAISYKAFKFLFNSHDTYVTCSHFCKLWLENELQKNTTCPQGELLKTKIGQKTQLLILFDVSEHVQFLYRSQQYASKMTYHRNHPVKKGEIPDINDGFRFKEKTSPYSARDVFFLSNEDGLVTQILTINHLNFLF